MRSVIGILGTIYLLWQQLPQSQVYLKPTRSMSHELLSADDAARRLGVTRATMYEWLANSDAGTLIIRGQPVTVNYFQGGRHGQGRIRIEADEVERLKELMRVRPRVAHQRRPLTRQQHYPGITVELGDPGD